MYKVYRHTAPSGNVYIGITRRKDVRRRFERGEGYRGNLAFYNAIKKYGWDNIRHEILFENLSKERACQLEIDLIRHYKNLGKSYNISDGGDCGFNGIVQKRRTGWHHSEETRRKISEHNKGKKPPCPYKGKKRDPEVGRKVSATKKGIATRGTGWHHSEETRRKISESHMGKIATPEAKIKMSLAKKANPGLH